MTGFLRKAGKNIINQVIAARAKVVKDDYDAIDRIMAEIDLSGWAVLAGDTQNILETITKDGAIQALNQLGISDEGIVSQANESAALYAKERSAEMVGMKWVAGKLVDNPDARWAITDATRDGIREAVAASFEGSLTDEDLANKIQADYTFSAKRATMIARTETLKADVNGNLLGWRASGQVDRKEWQTADDDLVSEDCMENQNAGVLKIDDLFPSGDVAPPAHPNCRCDLLPVLSEEK